MWRCVRNEKSRLSCRRDAYEKRIPTSLLGDVEECQTGRVEVYSYNSVALERDMSLELRFRFAEG